MAVTPTYTPNQIASMERLKASNALNAPPGSQNVLSNKVIANQKIITPGLKVTTADYTQAKAGGIATPASDLEAARIAYERSQTKPVVPPAPSPVEKAKTDFVTNTSSSAGITGGSDNIRNNMAQTSTQAGSLYNDLVKSQDISIANSDKKLAELDKQLADMNKFNEMDLGAIQQAGQEAGAKFIPQIAEAQQSLKQGLAKANVGAGERGGFMNTQFAGQAALTPTEGGNFVGAGGELSRIKGTLENNIQQLEIAKSTAENAAMEAARKAIRTGKKEDLQMAQSIYDRAVEADKLRQDMVTKRIDVISKLDTMNRENITFNQDQQDRALKQLDTISKVGADITPEMEQQIDSVYGPGFTLEYANAITKAADAKTEADKADAAATVIGIMSKLPAGTKRTINGVEYEGIAAQDPNTQLITETDNAGNLSAILIDKTTGKIISNEVIKGVGKTKSSGGGGGSTDISGVLSYDDWKSVQPEVRAAAQGTSINFSKDPFNSYSGNAAPQPDENKLKSAYDNYVTSKVNFKLTDSQKQELFAANKLGIPISEQIKFLKEDKYSAQEIERAGFLKIPVEEYRKLYGGG